MKSLGRLDTGLTEAGFQTLKIRLLDKTHAKGADRGIDDARL